MRLNVFPFRRPKEYVVILVTILSDVITLSAGWQRPCVPETSRTYSPAPRLICKKHKAINYDLSIRIWYFRSRQIHEILEQTNKSMEEKDFHAHQLIKQPGSFLLLKHHAWPVQLLIADPQTTYLLDTIYI